MSSRPSSRGGTTTHSPVRSRLGTPAHHTTTPSGTTITSLHPGLDYPPPQLDELVASALTPRAEKKPSRIDPTAHRPKASSTSYTVEELSPSYAPKLTAEEEALRKKQRREEELRAQIRSIESDQADADASALSRRATDWTRLQRGTNGERQYQPMARPHANPMWTVPSAHLGLLDELDDAEGDAYIQLAVAEQKANFDRTLHPHIQVRLSALQGDFNTRDPAQQFLKNIVGGVGKEASMYDPLHGSASTPSRSGSRSGSRSASRTSSRASMSRPLTTEAMRQHLLHPPPIPVPSQLYPPEEQKSHDSKNQTRDAVSELSSRASSALARPPIHPVPVTVRPSGKEFEAIPPVPSVTASVQPLSDRELLAQVFDTPIPSLPASPEPSLPKSTHDRKIDLANVPLPLDPVKPLPLFTPAPPPKPSSASTAVGVAIYRSAVRSSSSSNSDTSSRKTSRPASSVVRVNPTQNAGEVHTQAPSSQTTTQPTVTTESPSIEESKSNASITSPKSSKKVRPHTADATHQPKTAPSPNSSARAPSAATTTDGRRPVTGSQTSRTGSRARSRPMTGGTQSARVRPQSSTILQPGLSSFGYTDREVFSKPESIDAFCSGSSCQPLDIISRPHTSRNDSGGSTGLAHRGCAVRYRSTHSDHHDPLSERLLDTLVGGRHAQLDLKLFRREVELLTNTAGVTNATIKKLLNEKSTSDRIAVMRHKALQKKNADAGGAGSSKLDSTSHLQDLSGTNGLTHRLYQPMSSAKSSLPARYTKLAGTDVTPIPHTINMGEPTENPFRDLSHHILVSVKNNTLILDPTKYIGPGFYLDPYDMKDNMTKPNVACPVHYGPPHSNHLWEKMDHFRERTSDGPGHYNPKYSALGTETKTKGHVEMSRSVPRKEYDFLGLTADLKNPSSAAYDPWKHSKLWSDSLRHLYSEHSFGHGKRFEDSQYRIPTSNHDYILKNPARLLELASPDSGPGALHSVIPSRSGARSSYDPNMESYMRSKKIPELDSVLRFLKEEEINGEYYMNHTEGANSETAGRVRLLEQRTKEMDVLLSGALASVSHHEPDHQRTASTDSTLAATAVTSMVPVNLPTSGPPPTIDLLSTVPAEISEPGPQELRARAALFEDERKSKRKPSRSRSPTSKEDAEKVKDFTKDNRHKVLLASPDLKRETLKERTSQQAAHRRQVQDKGRKLKQNQLNRMREKIAAQNEAMEARAGGQLFINRWIVFTALASRTSWLTRVLQFSRRMNSDLHRRQAAVRIIARCWRRYHERIIVVRRRAAILTLSKVFGTFRIRLRIRRKQKAAALLRTFFRTIDQAGFQAPLAVNLKHNAPNALTGALPDESTVFDRQTLLNLRRKQREQAALLEKLKLKTNGERTLMGIIRHFKSQVIIMQRAWRAYCLMREYQVDMHVLLWDEILVHHYQAMYTKLHGVKSPTTAQIPLAAGASVATMFKSSSQMKPPERSQPFRQQKKAAEHARQLEEETKKELELHAKQEDKFGVNQPKSIPDAKTVVLDARPSPRPTSSPTRRLKLKPVVLKMDARFNTHEKRQILLEALKQRKLRFLRVKRHYLQQQQKFVSDQSYGLSAARRLLDKSESRFSNAFFARHFSYTHPPPFLPRLMSHRQMMQLMNAASLARKETRKTRYNMAQANEAAAATMSHHIQESAGRSVKHLFHTSSGAHRPGFGGTGSTRHEFDLTEMRLRESLLKEWANQLPIPTRPITLTPEEQAEDAEWEREMSLAAEYSKRGRGHHRDPSSVGGGHDSDGDEEDDQDPIVNEATIAEAAARDVLRQASLAPRPPLDQLTETDEEED